MLIISLSEFAATRWDYRSGQHVTILGPTDAGKTHLAHTLLGCSTSQHLPVVSLVMKPRSPTARKFGEQMQLRRLTDWPPPPRPFWMPRPTGWMVWPEHTMDPDIDEPRHHDIFRRAILHPYSKGRRLAGAKGRGVSIFADEAVSFSEELGLRRELNTVWSKGREMDVGLWATSQRPAYLPRLGYSMPEHIFLSNDPDTQAQKRYAEIGGINPKVTIAIVSQLPKWHWLYIKRTGRRYCVLTP